MALELLAPAKNLEQGTLALRCGADAVYMGGPQFGARQAAGNELVDFEQLTREARLWGAKVYATLNTLIYDHELEEARRQAWSLYEAGVDALIIQDMAYLEMDLPPLPLHASTQAACDSPERVAFLASAGFTRAILARELSLDDIRAIHGAADMELEAFVYGALCVGESGHCYLSGAICDRSGNRGACAQPYGRVSRRFQGPEMRAGKRPHQRALGRATMAFPGSHENLAARLQAWGMPSVTCYGHQQVARSTRAIYCTHTTMHVTAKESLRAWLRAQSGAEKPDMLVKRWTWLVSH